MRAAVERVQQHDNANLKLLGYVVSKFKRGRAFQQTYLRQIRETFGDAVFQTVIPDSAQFERSVDNAIPTTLHSPSSHASRIARQLFDEVESRICDSRTQEKHGGISDAGRQGCPRSHTTTVTRQ